VIVLGALCQLKHNKYSLEDPTGLVDLDLSEAKFHRGLYTENCFVLVEGWYEDLVFHVVAMGHPPIEKSEVGGFFWRCGDPLNATEPKVAP
jgi:DNA polymerase epsilon subunit 2